MVKLKLNGCVMGNGEHSVIREVLYKVKGVVKVGSLRRQHISRVEVGWKAKT